MRCFSINESSSKGNTRAGEKNKSSISGISSNSFGVSSGQDLDKVSRLMHKIKDISKIKDRLAVNYQNLKFKVAELQKEKYSLSQINKKLSAEVQKCRIDYQGIVILQKKDFHVLLTNYYNMSEELEAMSMIHSDTCANATVKVELADRYLKDLIESEERNRQFKIKESMNTAHLETKINLLKETLTNRNKEFKEYEGVQRNNEQLLSLLEKYDEKVTELQTEIDVRDLRIEELEGKEKKYNLKTLEDRVQFLIDLLEKCKTQLGYISDSDSHTNQSKKDKSEQKEVLNADEKKDIKEKLKGIINVDSNKIAASHNDSRKRIDNYEFHYEKGTNNDSLDTMTRIKKDALKSKCNSAFNYSQKSLI